MEKILGSSGDFEGGGCSVQCKHVVACSNKCPSCVSWGRNGLIAVGCGNSVVICNSHRKNESKSFKSVIKTLNTHMGRVNCVKWIRNHEDVRHTSVFYLVSGATDKSIILWKCQKVNESTGNDFSIEMSNVLKSHSGAITCLDGIIYSDSVNCSPKIRVVSASVDSSIKIWGSSTSNNPENIALLQTIDLQPSLALTISLHLLKDQIPVLACGLDNSKIRLYTKPVSNPENATEEFSLALSLHGHEDWVRGSDFVTLENGDLLLSTCSQDAFIRLWRIAPRNESDAESELDILKMKEIKFETHKDDKTVTYIVTLEAVLSAHEGWVYSVHWGHSGSDGSLRLLSSSMDKSVIIWKADNESGIWAEEAKFGEVGGNTLGFYGAVFNPKGSKVIAHSYNGALHLWEEVTAEENTGQWKTGVIISGHFGPVLDLSWEPKYGRYFLTTGSDQTTRLFGPWNVDNNISWHEIARPQVHGYDMQCVSMIDSFRFISGADEKVLRVFQAPENFIQNFEKLSGLKMERSALGPEGATVPALGLSNKAIFTEQTVVKKETPTSRGEQYIENQFRKFLLDQPPSEEHLLQNSLWPETHKLYWHVYEIFCVAANSLGTLVASAAKSATPQHSTIVLWDTETWKEVAELQGHNLTVTQMEFSHGGRFLLSVSRDRTWILHEISGNSDSGYLVSTFAKSDKNTCHARIIWSASWTHDDKYFCTGSRDKKMMFWKIEDTDRGDDPKNRIVSRTLVSAFSEPITAVSFATRFVNSSDYLLAIGKEKGTLELHIFAAVPEFSCVLLYKFAVHDSHATTVKRLRWRPQKARNPKEHWIASCAADNIVKLFQIEMR